jgi:hypothetical protein
MVVYQDLDNAPLPLGCRMFKASGFGSFPGAPLDEKLIRTFRGEVYHQVAGDFMLFGHALAL